MCVQTLTKKQKKNKPQTNKQKQKTGPKWEKLREITNILTEQNHLKVNN